MDPEMLEILKDSGGMFRIGEGLYFTQLNSGVSVIKPFQMNS